MIILCYGSIMDACTVISISIKSSNLNIYPIYVKRKLFLITIYSKQLSLFHVAICWKYMIFFVFSEKILNNNLKLPLLSRLLKQSVLLRRFIPMYESMFP